MRWMSCCACRSHMSLQPERHASVTDYEFDHGLGFFKNCFACTVRAQLQYEHALMRICMQCVGHHHLTVTHQKAKLSESKSISRLRARKSYAIAIGTRFNARCAASATCWGARIVQCNRHIHVRDVNRQKSILSRLVPDGLPMSV